MLMHEKKKNIFAAFGICLMIVALISVIIVSGRKKSGNMEYKSTGISMGTVLNITVYGEHGNESISDITSILDNLENNVISWRSKNSQVYKLNNEYKPGIPYEISSELAGYIRAAKELYEVGDGMLDITVRPLADLWGIEDGKNHIPDKNELEAALAKVDMQMLEITKDETYHEAVIIDDEALSIDFGAVGKGIAIDKVYEYLKKSDLKGACVSIGGSVVLYGEKPDKSSYRIGIKNPRGSYGEVMGVLELYAAKDGLFISTSGDYEKYFIKDGVRYHHILNPQNGYPADEGIISATIVCGNGLISDGLSTLAILLGYERILPVLEKYDADAVIIDSDMNVYITDGLTDNFILEDETYRVME